MFVFSKNKSKTMYCFSPEVMLATFIVEIVMAIYVFVRYRLSLSAKLVVAILVLLATFQAVEFRICTGDFDLYLAKIGFVAITLLPALGLHLISRIAKVRHLIKIGYFFAFLFIFHIIFSGGAISEAVCGGNYVIFETGQYLSFPYGLYYWILLLVGIWVSIDGILFHRRKEREARSLFWMMVGYLSFMVPMMLLYTWDRNLLTAAASVMCGFAVIFALILTFKVIDIYKQEDKKEIKLPFNK